MDTNWYKIDNNNTTFIFGMFIVNGYDWTDLGWLRSGGCLVLEEVGGFFGKEVCLFLNWFTFKNTQLFPFVMQIERRKVFVNTSA